MLPLSTTWFAVLLIALAATLAVGYRLGTLRARRVTRHQARELNRLQLQVLDERKLNQDLDRQRALLDRQQRLVRLTLARLKHSEMRCHELEQARQNEARQQFIARARFRLVATTMQQKAQRATQLARRATVHLKRLETTLPTRQTITAPAPKSYGQGEAVTVSIVDQHTPVHRHEQVARVSHRDSALLKQMHPSNDLKPRETEVVEVNPTLTQ